MREVLTTSRRCCTLSPEEPAAVSLRKECKVDMLKSGSKKQVLCGQQELLVWDSWDSWLSTVAMYDCCLGRYR